MAPGWGDAAAGGCRAPPPGEGGVPEWDRDAGEAFIESGRRLQVREAVNRERRAGQSIEFWERSDVGATIS